MTGKNLLALAVALILSFSSASAGAKTPPRRFGVGVVLGEPSGITAKYWLSGSHALDFGLAYSTGNSVLLYSDYLWHFFEVIKEEGSFFRQLSLYAGVGGFFGLTDAKAGSKARLGLRIPLGAEWRPKNPPLGVFVEIAPGIRLAPDTSASIHGGIGVRYFF